VHLEAVRTWKQQGVHLEAVRTWKQQGVHLEAVRGFLFFPLCKFAILFTLRVRYSFHFASSLFFTLCEFVILYILQLFISLYKQYTCTTPPGPRGRGAGCPMGRVKAPARV
jgi:hypothetical protein